MCLTTNKNPRNQSLSELLWLAVLCTCCDGSLLGELSAVHVIPLERTTGSLCLVSPGLYLMCLFPLLILICILSL